jgi:aspartyl-tRNA(Asn)/glutamyl-tRNA(Gln) amidotransferase subunit B
MKFETVIGLEVHVQLNTKTKIFCSCATSFGHEPNTNTCPVCLALPGALPVLNKEVVKKAAMFGKAINATINRRSLFDRKNYFYPDLPKGYQISQLPVPIVENGELTIDFDDGSQRVIPVVRAHLEEDAGKNIHDGDVSRVDLNRAGTPLLEIVSGPDMRSADEAIRYLKKLHAIVRYLDMSDANMQEGSFRCDANVSIRPVGDTNLYTRVEIKNLNSFRFIQKAIEFEVARQSEAWEDGVYEKEIYQETRLYDTVNNVTRSMRGKEGAADYRYFPDPDLPTLVVTDELMKEIEVLPELPDQKKVRFINDFAIKPYDAAVLTGDVEMARYFEEMVGLGASAKGAVTWLSVELQGRLKNGLTIETSPVQASRLAKLVCRIEDETISGKAAKEILDAMMEDESDVDTLIDKMGLAQVSDDGAILAIIDGIIAANPAQVEQYRAGKEALFGFFVGQTMKASQGSASPAKVNELLKARLSS